MYGTPGAAHSSVGSLASSTALGPTVGLCELNLSKAQGVIGGADASLNALPAGCRIQTPERSTWAEATDGPAVRTMTATSERLIWVLMLARPLAIWVERRRSIPGRKAGRRAAAAWCDCRSSPGDQPLKYGHPASARLSPAPANPNYQARGFRRPVRGPPFPIRHLGM